MKTDTSRISTAKSSPQAHLKFHKTNDNFLIDFGATISILDPHDLQAISQHYKILLTLTRTKVKAFGSDRPIELSGKFDAVVESKKRITVATFYVTKQENGSLLSCNTSQELGLIHFPCMQSDCSSKNRSEAVKLKKAFRTKITRNRNPESKSQTPVVAEVKGASNCKYEQILRANYPAVFEGIGKLHGHEQKLHIDESIPPPPYRRHTVVPLPTSASNWTCGWIRTKLMTSSSQ